MNAFDYAAQMRQAEAVVQTAALLLEGVELDRLRETLDRVDTIGFIVDPTAYARALSDHRLERQRELLAALRPLAAYIAKRRAEEVAP